MSGKEARVDRDDDGHNIEQLHAEKDLRRRLEEAMTGRGYWFKKCLALETELTAACAELEQAKFDSWKRIEQLAQAREELKDLQGANRALGQQVVDVKENRDYWYDTCRATEAECDKMRKRAQASEADLKLNAKMLADQCDQVRQAESERDEWRRKAQEWGRDTWSKKVIESLRQQLKEVKSECDIARKEAQYTRYPTTRAEALAQLANGKTAALMERLAGYAQVKDSSHLLRAHLWCNKDASTARALAARIREALEKTE